MSRYLGAGPTPGCASGGSNDVGNLVAKELPHAVPLPRNNAVVQFYPAGLTSRVRRRAVPAPGVVEVLAPRHHDLGFGGEMVPGQDLVFEGREERLRSGVIET